MAARDAAAPGSATRGGSNNHDDALNVTGQRNPLPVVRGSAFQPSADRHELLVVVPRCVYCGGAHAHRALGARVAGCRRGSYVVLGGAA